MSISDTMVVMNQGRIQQLGTPLEIYKRSATEFVADFIGITNFLKADVTSTEAERILVDLYGASLELSTDERFEAGEEVTIVARPEMLRFAEEGKANMRGKIRNGFFLGPLARYEIDVGDGDLVILDDPNPSGLRQRGSLVFVEIITDSINVKKRENVEMETNRREQ